MEQNNFKLQELIQAEVNKKSKDMQLKVKLFENNKQEGINIEEKAKQERILFHQLKLKRDMDDSHRNIKEANQVKLSIIDAKSEAQMLTIQTKNMGKRNTAKDATQVQTHLTNSQTKTVNTKYNKNRLQKLGNCFDLSNKMCVVPFARSETIEKLTVTTHRTYENNFAK